MMMFENLVNYDGFKSEDCRFYKVDGFENLVNYDGFKSVDLANLDGIKFENLVNYDGFKSRWLEDEATRTV